MEENGLSLIVSIESATGRIPRPGYWAATHILWDNGRSPYGVQSTPFLLYYVHVRMYICLSVTLSALLLLRPASTRNT